MYTQCPGCKTVFRIDVARLKQARGEVLCQHCHRIFNALESLSETVNAASANDAPQTVPPPALGPGESVSTSRYERERTPPLKGGKGISAKHSPYLARGQSVDRPHEIAPANAESAKSHEDARYATWGWALGSLLLGGLLLAQVALFEGPRLAQQAGLRPLLEKVCKPLGCSLPPFRQSERIRIVDRLLQTAPDDIDGFEFTLIMVNQASLPQAYPHIRLALTDPRGKPIAVRQFKPEEYLGNPHPPAMPVGQPVEIRLLLARPTREIGGFSFELL